VFVAVVVTVKSPVPGRVTKQLGWVAGLATAQLCPPGSMYTV
jgi:hypothetical protein